jgi:hypothetical protein
MTLKQAIAKTVPRDQRAEVERLFREHVAGKPSEYEEALFRLVVCFRQVCII